MRIAEALSDARPKAVAGGFHFLLFLVVGYLGGCILMDGGLLFSVVVLGRSFLWRSEWMMVLGRDFGGALGG